MSEMVERVARAILEESKNFGPLAHHMGDEFEKRLARAAIEAMIPFFKEIPSANFIRTTDTDPGRVWSIAAEVQLGAVIGHLQAALKEQA